MKMREMEEHLGWNHLHVLEEDMRKISSNLSSCHYMEMS